MGIDYRLQRHAGYALLAAALFGASTPVAKWLLANTSPLLLAGLLYLGSGLGLGLVRLIRARVSARLARPLREELRGRQWLWLAGAVLSGGVVAPILLLWGLSGSAASSTSLLLNLEGVATTAVAALVFREAVSGRVWAGAVLMLVAACLLGYAPGTKFGFSLHALAVVGACIAWAFDNNLTRPISTQDPTAVALIKGLAAGSFNLALGFAVGGRLPDIGSTVAALGVGAISYGASLVLFILALRHIGSARTAAHFGTAPFVGVALSIVFLGEPMGSSFVAALVLMVAATWLVVSERHEHEHTHEATEHSHEHVRDGHHDHAHRGDEGPEPHTHSHRHEPRTHSHAHLPDIHHRHDH